MNSVAIVSSDSGLGDALSTGVFCMPVEKGQALIEQLNDVEAVKNDLGVRETVVNDREVRGIHIHTNGFNSFAGFPGIAHE